MLDSISVPRRSYDFEDYIDILRRNFRWVIAPAFLGLVISIVVAYSMPDVYISTATIRVTPQQISERLIQNVTSQDVADRISGMAQIIYSRATLTSIINNFHPVQEGAEKRTFARRHREHEKGRHYPGIRQHG